MTKHYFWNAVIGHPRDHPPITYLIIIFHFTIYLIEKKTLSYEKYKPLTMRPGGFLGMRYINVCIFKQDCSLATGVDCRELPVVMEVVQAFLKVPK